MYFFNFVFGYASRGEIQEPINWGTFARKATWKGAYFSNGGL